jgi:hypothetical protein
VSTPEAQPGAEERRADPYEHRRTFRLSDARRAYWQRLDTYDRRAQR